MNIMMRPIILNLLKSGSKSFPYGLLNKTRFTARFFFIVFNKMINRWLLPIKKSWNFSKKIYTNFKIGLYQPCFII
jgi:hypothetical protein